MNCIYHQVTLANTRCQTCAKPLCPACDHRVKGFTYCQDCIVAGIENLTAGPTSRPVATIKSPAAAAFLGLIPGLGSVYNGLVVRALVHFAVIVGLWQLDDIFDASLFWWAGIAFYAYSIFDAFQNAKRFNAGHDLNAEEENLKNQLREKTKIWGSVLISIGILSILHYVFPDTFMTKLWPPMLIGIGLYFVATFQSKSKARMTKHFSAEFRTPAPSAVSFDPLTHDYQETRRLDLR